MSLSNVMAHRISEKKPWENSSSFKNLFVKNQRYNIQVHFQVISPMFFQFIVDTQRISDEYVTLDKVVIHLWYIDKKAEHICGSKWAAQVGLRSVSKQVHACWAEVGFGQGKLLVYQRCINVGRTTLVQRYNVARDGADHCQRGPNVYPCYSWGTTCNVCPQLSSVLFSSPCTKCIWLWIRQCSPISLKISLRVGMHGISV